MAIRIAYIEDNSSLRKRLQEQLAFFEDIELVAAYASGATALNDLPRLKPSEFPEIILMDIGMPGMTGIEATISIKELFPEIEIMMYTVFEEAPKIFQAIRAGASGSLLKDDPMESVVEAIRELKSGGAPMSQTIARKVLTFFRPLSPPSERKHENPPPLREPSNMNLSERELELLEGLVHGETYATLARKLSISPHTVKTHIKNIYRKLHVHSRALAVRVALERGLV